MESCTHCDSVHTVKLNETKREGNKAVMSDGSLANDFDACQCFCEECGAFFISYHPPDRLERYFSEEYDVSDEVQDCQVVLEGKRKGKHSVIHQSLLDSCSGLGSKGNFLEIACGNGLLSKKFSQQHQNWQCFAVDPSHHSSQHRHGGVHFIQDFFSPSLFKKQKFDVVVAHGILNRTPTLEMLKGITSLCKKNALLSFEIVTLENSSFAPYIWDHSYTFLESVFCQYLNSLAIKINKRVNCGSTLQFICSYTADPKPQKLCLGADSTREALALYREHLSAWDRIFAAHLEWKAKYPHKKIALFGAGLYSAILFSRLGKANVDVVIDEVRAGRSFEGMRIIDLDEALKLKKELLILLCARPTNMKYLKEKLDDDFQVISL